jgi:hypothetical protein
MSSEPQTDIQLLTVPFNEILLTEAAWNDVAEEPVETGLLAVPRGANFRIEVLRIGYVAQLAVIGTTVTVDIEYQDSLLTGAALVTAANTFSLTNATEDRVFDADTAANQELANVLGTFVSDLQRGPPYSAYTIGSLTTDRDADISGPPADAVIADILGTFINDVFAGSLPYYNLTNITTDRDADMSSPPSDQVLADILATLITDLRVRSDLVTTHDLETALIQDYNSLYVGSQILEAGDSINAEFVTTTITTGGEGYSFIVEYRVLQRS